MVEFVKVRSAAHLFHRKPLLFLCRGSGCSSIRFRDYNYSDHVAIETISGPECDAGMPTALASLAAVWPFVGIKEL
jgi:hypothetical protein